MQCLVCTKAERRRMLIFRHLSKKAQNRATYFLSETCSSSLTVQARADNKRPYAPPLPSSSSHSLMSCFMYEHIFLELYQFSTKYCHLICTVTQSLMCYKRKIITSLEASPKILQEVLVLWIWIKIWSRYQECNLSLNAESIISVQSSFVEFRVLIQDEHKGHQPDSQTPFAKYWVQNGWEQHYPYEWCLGGTEGNLHQYHSHLMAPLQCTVPVPIPREVWGVWR